MKVGQRDAAKRARVSVVGEGNAAGEDALRRGRGMRPQSRRVLVLGVVFLLVLAAGMLAPRYIFDGTTMVTQSITQVYDQVRNNITAIVNLLTGADASFETQLMGVLVAAASGCALGLCGSAYQGAFNNNLAAPKTLGVMSGGALGALVWVVLENYGALDYPMMPYGGSITTSQMVEYNLYMVQHDPLAYFMMAYGKCIFSVLGCFVVVGVVMAVSAACGRGRLSNILVIVVGQAIGAAVTGLITFLRYYYTTAGGDAMAQELAEIENYTMVDTYYFQDALVVILPLLVCIGVVLTMRNRLNLLSFGDDEARAMGVSVNSTRYLMIFVCTFMTAWAISFAGHIAFLGFISAHIARRAVGPDFRWLLPASVFTGGALITVVQWICNSGLPYTNPHAAGQVCSILGACIFLVLVVREAKGALRDGR